MSVAQASLTLTAAESSAPGASSDAALPRYAATTCAIAADDLRRAARDHLAELEHDHLVADPEHEAHVVVDEQHRLAAVHERAQPPAELLALACVETGRRLVEAHDARLRDERARDADELALSLGQLARQTRRRSPAGRAASSVGPTRPSPTPAA